MHAHTHTHIFPRLTLKHKEAQLDSGFFSKHKGYLEIRDDTQFLLNSLYSSILPPTINLGLILKPIFSYSPKISLLSKTYLQLPFRLLHFL